MQYILSDIHGRGDRFNDVLSQIRLKDSDTLYVLGDVIDRNPDGVDLLLSIRETPNFVMLLGNHEYMLLDHFAHPGDEQKRSRWQDRNGGMITYERLMRLADTEREGLIEWLRTLPVSLDVTAGGQEYHLVHAAPVYLHDPSDGKSDTYFQVWHRLTDEEVLDKGPTVVFGHTKTKHYQCCSPMQVYHGQNRLGIDCGCSDPEGRLACVRLDDRRVFYSSI